MIQPALFLSHGSPLIALAKKEDDDYVRKIHELGNRIKKPEAILMISAHWYEPSKKVDVSEKPEMIYDFYGFPDTLYDIRYECAGYPEGYDLLMKHCPEEGWSKVKRGLDHGSWTILRHLYPDADVKVFSISMDSRDNLESYFSLGKKLRKLREEGIMIIGNGNLIHDLSNMDFDREPSNPYPFAMKFDEAFKRRLLFKDYEDLLHPEMLPGGMESVPTLDHYAPAMIILGAAYENEEAEDIFEGFELGSIGRRAFGFGI